MRVGVLILSLATVASVVAQPAGGIRRLAWLQGCWEAASAAGSVEEQWMAPRGGSMLGMSRSVRRDALKEYELLVIRERGSSLVYVAHPSGQPSAEFVSSSVTEHGVVFENPAHDFPQRIGYERDGSSLQAWIEGLRQGNLRRVEFAYHRTACAGD